MILRLTGRFLWVSSLSSLSRRLLAPGFSPGRNSVWNGFSGRLPKKRKHMAFNRGELPQPNRSGGGREEVRFFLITQWGGDGRTGVFPACVPDGARAVVPAKKEGDTARMRYLLFYLYKEQVQSKGYTSALSKPTSVRHPVCPTRKNRLGFRLRRFRYRYIRSVVFFLSECYHTIG